MDAFFSFIRKWPVVETEMISPLEGVSPPQSGLWVTGNRALAVFPFSLSLLLREGKTGCITKPSPYSLWAYSLSCVIIILFPCNPHCAEHSLWSPGMQGWQGNCSFHTVQGTGVLCMEDPIFTRLDITIRPKFLEWVVCQINSGAFTGSVFPGKNWSCFRSGLLGGGNVIHLKSHIIERHGYKH